MLLAAIAGCTGPSPQPPGLRLTKVGFAELPQWKDTDAASSLASFQRSCAVLTTKADNMPMGGAGYAGTVADWRAVCTNAKAMREISSRRTSRPLRRAAARLCSPAIMNRRSASRTRHGAYQTPVYGPAIDLVAPILVCSIPS